MTNIIWDDDYLGGFGTFTEPMPPDAPRYDFGKIKEYCRENNKTLAEMTYEEIEQFRSGLRDGE